MQSAPTVNIATPLDITKFRGISVSIIADAGTSVSDFGNTRTASTESSTNIVYVITDRVTLTRANGSYYAAAAWSSNAINRGWVTIWYVE